MSERWIKLTHELARKPEVFSLARRLDQKHQTVLGCLFLLWMWFDEQTTDGFLSNMTAQDSDSVVGCDGFSVAAEAIGWLEICNDGLRMPHFSDHTSQSAKTRASDARRKRVTRKTTGHLSESKRTSTGQKPDQRRLEEIRKNTGPEGTGPVDICPDNESQPLTRWVESELKTKGTTIVEPINRLTKPRQCWTASAGWSDRLIGELSSREPQTVRNAQQSLWRWFRFQLGAPDPVCPEATAAAGVAVVAIAREAAKRPGIKNRVAWFRSTLTTAKVERLSGSEHLKPAAAFVVEHLKSKT